MLSEIFLRIDPTDHSCNRWKKILDGVYISPRKCIATATSESNRQKDKLQNANAYTEGRKGKGKGRREDCPIAPQLFLGEDKNNLRPLEEALLKVTTCEIERCKRPLRESW